MQPMEAWPALALDQWQDSYATVHLWTQMLGKTRLALSPPENHYWHTALYVTPRGLTTSAMPCRERTVDVELDFVDHQLVVEAGTVEDAREREAGQLQRIADRCTAKDLGQLVDEHLQPRGVEGGLVDPLDQREGERGIQTAATG